MLWGLLTQTQMLHSVAPPRIETRSLRRLRSRNPFQMPFLLELSYHIMTDPHWLASKLVIWPGLWTSGLQCLKELIQHWLYGFVKLTDYGPFWPSIRPRLSPSRADVAEKLIDVWNCRRKHISPWDDSGRNYPHLNWRKLGSLKSCTKYIQILVDDGNIYMNPLQLAGKARLSCGFSLNPLR